MPNATAINENQENLSSDIKRSDAVTVAPEVPSQESAAFDLSINRGVKEVARQTRDTLQSTLSGFAALTPPSQWHLLAATAAKDFNPEADIPVIESIIATFPEDCKKAVEAANPSPTDKELPALLVAQCAQENITPAALFAAVEQVGGRVLADSSYRKEIIALLLDIAHPQTATLATHGFDEPQQSLLRGVDLSILMSTGQEKLGEVLDAIETFQDAGIHFETIKFFGPLSRHFGSSLYDWANDTCSRSNLEEIYAQIRQKLDECHSVYASMLQKRVAPFRKNSSQGELIIFLSAGAA
jgi:hypothetical protein